MKKEILIYLVAFMAFSFAAAGQQWSGSTGPTGLITRDGNVLLGGSSIIGSYATERVMQIQGSTGAVFGMRATSFSPMPMLDMYLGNSYLNINMVNGPMYLSTNYASRITILGNGNVGIGTSSPGTFKLAVEGNIGAREVQVTLANPWPDYVFESGYKLMPLEELQLYIATHQHLPAIPSAQEVKDNGHNLGEMDALLLRKIEEITLYVIDQNKKSEEMMTQVECLKRIINEQSKEIERLKKAGH